MKRAISLLLAILMVVVCLPKNVYAAIDTSDMINPTIVVDSKYAAPGTSVEVDLLLVNNPGVSGAKVTVSYDSNLRLSNAVSGEAFVALDYTKPGNYNSPCSFTWDSENAEVLEDGVILTLIFDVSESAQPNQKMSINLSYRYGDIYDNDLNSVAFEMVSGFVSIIDYIPGDVNSDGVVNGKDITLVRRYYAGGYDTIIKEVAADVNDDGIINGKDITLMRRYNAGGYEGIMLLPSSKWCNHSMEYAEATEASCTELGNDAYWHCNNCGKYYRDEAGSIEISFEQTILPAIGHAYSKEWTFDQNYHWHAAVCEHTDLVKDRAEHTVGMDKLCKVCGMSNAPDPAKPYKITYKLVEYNKQNGDTYLETLHIDNSQNRTWFSATDSFELVDPNCGEAYTFNGWYTENGTKVTKISAGTKEDITLYARWTEKTFKVTYNVYQTPVGEITDEKVLSYKPSEGLTGLPNPEVYNYVFLGWYNNDGKEVREIPVGTTGDITLKPYLTSKRNLARAVKSLENPIIIESSDDGVIYFTYELGTIENVPLSDAIWTIQSVAGLAQQKSETVTTSISEGKALEIAGTISKTTVDSATWTLSRDWNDVTSVSEEWAKENGMEVEKATEKTKTKSGTISVTTSNGGCDTTTTTDGTTAVTYDSQNYTHGNSAEFNAKVHGSYSAEVNAGVKLEGLVDVGASSKWEVGGEIGGGYEQHKETDEHTGTDTTSVNTTVTSGSTSWNNTDTSSETKAASQSESVKKALSEIISATKGYGKSYSSGGENSESQEFSASDSKSVSTTSALTYSSSETKTTTTTYSTDGKSDGWYRLVIAGTVHVFGVVGYDVATQSYFTYTFNVMDDKTYEFLDYSPNQNFDDYQNGVLPFEIPYFVHEYVTSKTALTESLAYTTDSTTGTAKVTSFGENIGTKDTPNWIYPSLDVVVPSYIASGGNAYKVTEISETAFAGKPIRSIILSDYVTTIPDNAFKDCDALEQISGRFVTIGDNAFSGCTMLEDFTISPRTTSIGTNAFEGVTTLKMNALYAEFVPTNADGTTQDVIQSAIESGAENVSIDISEIAVDTVLTLDVPTIDSFELIGNKKVTYKDLKITSLASVTKLRNLTVDDCTSVPLEIKNGDLILDTVNITAPSFVLLLAKDGATISLLRDSKLTSQAGNAVVTKNPQVESLKDENVWGSLRVTGNFYYYGNEPDTSYTTIYNGKLIQLTKTEFEGYIQGCFKITFNPNGGDVDVTEMTAFVGQSLGTLPVPTRTGHNFEGWFDSNGVQITETSSFSSVQDIALTAKWSAMAYSATWNTGTGYSITVNRTSSPYEGASTGSLSSGATVYYGDVLSISYSANTGYSLTSKGTTSITVNGNVTSSQIYATAKVNSYAASWSGGTGYSISVKRTSSPNAGASTGTISSGSAVYYGDVLSVTYTASTGYSLTSKGSTSITVTGNVTSSTIYASAKVNSYTYNIVYKSSNGTSLGSSTATYNYGTTNTISPKSFSGYNTPGAQSVKWDSTSAKTITFIYEPSPVSNSTINGTFTSSSPKITYSTTMSYRNRTATSIQVQVTTTVTMQSGWPGYVYGVAFRVSNGSVNSGKVQIASYQGLSSGGSSRTASTDWMTIPLNTTNATTISFSANMYNTNWQDTYVNDPAYADVYYTWSMNVPAY